MEMAHYATREDLAQLETRVVERIGALETRLVRDMRESEHRAASREWRILGIVVSIAAVMVAVIRYFGRSGPARTALSFRLNAGCRSVTARFPSYAERMA